MTPVDPEDRDAVTRAVGADLARLLHGGDYGYDVAAVVQGAVRRGRVRVARRRAAAVGLLAAAVAVPAGVWAGVHPFGGGSGSSVAGPVASSSGSGSSAPTGGSVPVTTATGGSGGSPSPTAPTATGTTTPPPPTPSASRSSGPPGTVTPTTVGPPPSTTGPSASTAPPTTTGTGTPTGSGTPSSSPPTTSTPPASTGTASIGLTRGAATTGGWWYSVRLTGFAAQVQVMMTCRDSANPAGFATVSGVTAADGTLTNPRLCVGPGGQDHWVTSGPAESAHVPW